MGVRGQNTRLLSEVIFSLLIVMALLMFLTPPPPHTHMHTFPSPPFLYACDHLDLFKECRSPPVQPLPPAEEDQVARYVLPERVLVGWFAKRDERERFSLPRSTSGQCLYSQECRFNAEV